MITLQKINIDLVRFFRDMKKRGFLTNVQFIHQTSTDYDPTSGDATTTEDPTFVDVFLTNFNKHELTNQIQTTDLKCVLIRADVNDTIAIDDSVVVGGVEYKVLNFLNNPFEPAIVLQLRA